MERPELLILVVGSGALLVGLAIPLIARRVPPNPLYGLRVPATFKDEWVWYEANARSGLDMRRLGIILMVVPMLLALLPISTDLFAYLCMGLAAGGVILIAIVGWRRANRLFDDRRSKR
jgi:uncharacterized membrane protein